MNQFILDGKSVRTNLAKSIIETLYQMWQIRIELGMGSKNFAQYVKGKHPDCIIQVK